MRLGLLVLLVNAAAGIFMAGFIWTMQLIHYPLFDYVGEEAFPAYKITPHRLFLLVAGPGILVTLATSVLLIFARPQQIPLWAVLLRLAFFAVIVVSTAFFQAPQHQVLSGHFDPDAYAFLLNTNRIRTAAWSAYGILDLWMTWQAARAIAFAQSVRFCILSLMLANVPRRRRRLWRRHPVRTSRARSKRSAIRGAWRCWCTTCRSG